MAGGLGAQVAGRGPENPGVAPAEAHAAPFGRGAGCPGSPGRDSVRGPPPACFFSSGRSGGFKGRRGAGPSAPTPSQKGSGGMGQAAASARCSLGNLHPKPTPSLKVSVGGWRFAKGCLKKTKDKFSFSLKCFEMV